MRIFLLEKNEELAREVIKRLTGYTKGIETIEDNNESKNIEIWKKDVNHPYFYILFKPEWLTFALRVKDEKYENEARELLNCEVFDKYNLTRVKEEFFNNKWVYRNFYYPNARVYREDIINMVVKAFEDLENLAKSEAEKISQSAAQNLVNAPAAENIK